MRLTFRRETWPLREPFVISRMRQEDAPVGVVEIAAEGFAGRGECDLVEDGQDGPSAEEELAAIGPDAAARDPDRLANPRLANAVASALVDLEARRTGIPAWRALGLEAPPGPVTTVFTIGLGTPEAMAASADANRDRPILKLKLGRPEGDVDRVRAVREAAPAARLTVDANTGWTRDQLADHLPRLADLGVEMVEQPFPPDEDRWLDGLDRVLPLAADESFGPGVGPADLAGRYDLVNIKLDKQRGPVRAMALAREAQALGLGVMVGCNLGTSLAMAPAILVAQGAVYVDLDGPLLLARDREPGLRYEGSTIHPVDGLWG